MRILFAPTILALFSIVTASGADRPNIVFIVADDMGYADISSFGAPDVETPHIDQIGKKGIRFTNIYAMGPECTPSRVSFLTGRYPQRVGGMECAIGTGNVGRYDDAIRLAEDSDLGLPAEYAILAPSLKEAGYTNAIFGKWHLGYEPKFSPLLQGFDQFTGFLGGNVDYFRHQELSDLEVYLKGNNPITREGYTTDLITKDALEFIATRGKQPDAPFFLYLPHAAPHFPFQGPKDDDGGLPSAEEWTLGSRETYIKMMRSLDDSVGAIVAELEEQGLLENTLLIFTSDHGAMKPGLNLPWRDFKGTLFDGGIRVPLLAQWPGHLKPGKTSAQVGTLMDLTGSFLHLADAKLPQGITLDGDDIIEHALSESRDYSRTLFWRSRRGEKTWRAVREGNWKYVRKIDKGVAEEWLFDLETDPGEEKNLLSSEKSQSKAAELREKLSSWEKKVSPER